MRMFDIPAGNRREKEIAMNRKIVKRSLIGLGLLAIVGAAGAAVYTHEVAEQQKSEQNAPIAEQTDDGWSDSWAALHSDMMRIQEDMNHQWAQAMDEFHHLPGATQMPASGSIQLKDQGDKYVVTANIPGASEHNINVNLDGRLLSISSQTQGADKTTNDQGQVIEQDRYTSTYQQAFTLPGPVNAVGMHTNFKDGLLTVTIPKLTS
jgi:HSP20 family protein